MLLLSNFESVLSPAIRRLSLFEVTFYSNISLVSSNYETCILQVFLLSPKDMTCLQCCYLIDMSFAKLNVQLSLWFTAHNGWIGL